MANPFVHVELMTNDVGRAKKFFGKLFNWKLRTPKSRRHGLHYGQGRRGDRWWDHEEPDAERAFDVGRLRRGGRCRAGNEQGQIPGRQVMKDVTDIKGHGIILHYHRSDRCDAWPVAVEERLDCG